MNELEIAADFYAQVNAEKILALIDQQGDKLAFGLKAIAMMTGSRVTLDSFKIYLRDRYIELAKAAYLAGADAARRTGSGRNIDSTEAGRG